MIHLRIDNVQQEHLSTFTAVDYLRDDILLEEFIIFIEKYDGKKKLSECCVQRNNQDLYKKIGPTHYKKDFQKLDACNCNTYESDLELSSILKAWSPKKS